MLTFAGEPLLFPDVRVLEFLEGNQELADTCLFSANQARFASARQACRSRFEINKGLGLPVWNWPAPPPPRLNTLYWPTGATRWAYGLFLVTRQTRDKLFKRLHSGNGNAAGTLLMGDDLDGGGLSPYAIDLFMLTPRPVSCLASDDDLWIIPLVDERYFWQFLSVGDLEVTGATTWTQLFTSLGGIIGKTIQVDGDIVAAYQQPDAVEFTRPYDNVGLFIDAAASSVGRRFVRRITGEVFVESPSVANTTLEANLARPHRQLAGGDYGALGGDLPAKVAVTFRKIKQYLLRSNGQVHVEEVDPPEGAPVRVANSGTRLTIHCATYAGYDVDDNLDNEAELEGLAEQIAADYYAWTAKRYDYTFAEIQPWDLCGSDDHVLWTFGRPLYGAQSVHVNPEPLEEGEGARSKVKTATAYLAQTRVQSLPANVWPELNACSQSFQEVFEPRMIAIAKEDIDPEEEGEVTLWDGFEHSLERDVVIRNISGVVWSNTARGWAEGIGDAEWVGVPTECEE